MQDAQWSKEALLGLLNMLAVILIQCLEALAKYCFAKHKVVGHEGSDRGKQNGRMSSSDVDCQIEGRAKSLALIERRGRCYGRVVVRGAKIGSRTFVLVL
jgi:hypothetical protein